MVDFRCESIEMKSDLFNEKEGIMLFWMIMSSVFAAIGGLMIYMYYLHKGQFEDVESVKYQLFREDNPDD